MRQLHAIDADWLPYRLLLARNALMRGRTDEALAQIPAEESLRHDPAAASEAWRLAVDAQDLRHARRLARVAMEAGDAASAIAMGRELLKQGDLDDVVQWVTDDPDWFHRADLRGGWCTLLDELLEIDPNHLAALKAWLALASEGDAAAPALAPRRQRLAELSREQGDLPTALEQYRLLARQLPISAVAREAVRELEEQLGLTPSMPPEPAAVDEQPRASDDPAPAEPFPGLSAAPDSGPVEGRLPASVPADAIVELDDEWAQVADQDLEESIRQIEFFSQNGMLPAAREVLDRELARLPHEPRLQALDIVLRTRMESAAGVEAAGSSAVAGATEFSLTPLPSEPGGDAAPFMAQGTDWLDVKTPEPAPQPSMRAAAGAGATGSRDGGEALPGEALPGDAAWADWLQPEPAGTRSQTPTESKEKGGEAGRLLDDLFDDFRTTIEAGDANSASDPEHQYNMGVAYYEMGLFEEGVAELQKSFLGWESQPNPPRDRLLSCGSTIALCFQQINMPDMALSWYRRTIDAARLPVAESIGLLYEEGRLLEQLGRREEALDCYRQVYATNIDYQDVAECLKRVQASSVS